MNVSDRIIAIRKLILVYSNYEIRGTRHTFLFQSYSTKAEKNLHLFFPLGNFVFITQKGSNGMNDSKPIYQFKPGDTLEIVSVQLSNVMRRRLLDLGFVPGSTIEVVQKSPLGDPVAFKVFDTQIALRKEESSLIFAKKI